MRPLCPGSPRNPSRAFTLPSPTLLERYVASHFRMSGDSLECQIDKLEIPVCRETPAHGRPGKGVSEGRPIGLADARCRAVFKRCLERSDKAARVHPGTGTAGRCRPGCARSVHFP